MNAVDKSEVVQIATQDAHTTQQLQSKTTVVQKAKWIGQKKELTKHIEEIHASNNFIRDIVSLRALKSIHSGLVGADFDKKIPMDVLAVQDSLIRLHHALKHANEGSQDQGPAVVSVRMMTAAAYLRLKNKLILEHDYIEFQEDTLLYPLQIQPAAATSSTVVLAETTRTAPANTVPRVELDRVISLSGLLSSQPTDADNACKSIGSITSDQGSPHTYSLFQDITTSWTVQETLAGLIDTETKFRTYIQLALQVSLSYVYLVAIGTTHRYPRLVDYRYYKMESDAKRQLNPNKVLEPYLSVGFGSKGPRRSTQDIGGASYSSTGDEAMISLGIILHELGCKCSSKVTYPLFLVGYSIHWYGDRLTGKGGWRYRGAEICLPIQSLDRTTSVIALYRLKRHIVQS